MIVSLVYRSRNSWSVFHYIKSNLINLKSSSVPFPIFIHVYSRMWIKSSRGTFVLMNRQLFFFFTLNGLSTLLFITHWIKFLKFFNVNSIFWSILSRSSWHFQKSLVSINEKGLHISRRNSLRNWTISTRLSWLCVKQAYADYAVPVFCVNVCLKPGALS